MTYIEWLLSQRSSSGLKGLAHDIDKDNSFPKQGNFKSMYEYMDSLIVDPKILRLFLWSYEIYLDYLKSYIKEIEEKVIKKIEE